MKNITKRKYNEYEGRFIIPVMDPPMENTEAGTKDGIPDGNRFTRAIQQQNSCKLWRTV